MNEDTADPQQLFHIIQPILNTGVAVTSQGTNVVLARHTHIRLLRGTKKEEAGVWTRERAPHDRQQLILNCNHSHQSISEAGTAFAGIAELVLPLVASGTVKELHTARTLSRV